MNDPLETMIAEALELSGIQYQRENENPAHLDFYLPDFRIHIEVKGGHSPRIARQMKRSNNVIVAQGMTAVKFLASAIGALKK